MKRTLRTVDLILAPIVFLVLAQTTIAAPDVINPPQDAPIDSTDRKNVEEQILSSFRNDALLSEDARKADVSFDESGKVILRGIVRSPEERAKIEANAIRIVGNGRVVNHLEIRVPSTEIQQRQTF